MSETFTFIPGERLRCIISQPGADTIDCEVLQDDGGEEVLIRREYPGFTPDEVWRRRSDLVWMRGSATSDRFRLWKMSQGSGQ